MGKEGPRVGGPAATDMTPLLGNTEAHRPDGAFMRFKTDRDFARYCRAVDALQMRNGKQKGENTETNWLTERGFMCIYTPSEATIRHDLGGELHVF